MSKAINETVGLAAVNSTISYWKYKKTKAQKHKRLLMKLNKSWIV